MKRINDYGMLTMLKSIIEDSDTRLGRWFDLFIQFLILTSIVTFSIETLPNNSNDTKHWLYIIEVICVVIFSIEYVLRVIVADKPLRFIFSFFGVVDLLSILPFYVAFGIDLRTLRAFRLLRIFRAFKLVRYNKAIKRFQKAFVSVREEIVLYLFVTLILLYLTSVGIFYFENEAQPEKFRSVFDALWWAVATLTTVGYGDIYPVTTGGKIFTFVILMIGLSVVSIPAGLIASAFSAKSRKDH